jgi:hypothetical protein
MPALGSQWPSLSRGLRENSTANLNSSDRFLAVNHDVYQLLEHVGKGGKVRLAVLEYLKVM